MPDAAPPKRPNNRKPDGRRPLRGDSPRSNKPHGDHKGRGGKFARSKTPLTKEEESAARRAALDPSALPEGLGARVASLDLMAMVDDGHTLDDALALCRSFNALEGPDRGFARALVGTMLRRRGSLDALIEPYLKRPFPKRARRAMHILRCAGAQSLFLETPPHAAVSTAVELAKLYRETEALAGVVNAVARKLAEKGPQALAKLPDRTDTAGWLWRSWERAYGPAAARIFARVHRATPPLDLTLKTPDNANDLAEKLAAAELSATVVGAGSVRLTAEAAAGRPVEQLPGFAEGDWWVQDAAATIPAQLLGDVAGKNVVDLCAAPGGKTMQLAAAGGNVVAVDKAAGRLRRLQDNLDRTGLSAEVRQADASEWRPDAPADAVLLDAPCTATGVIRRRPDVMWSKTADDVAALAPLQARLLDNARAIVRPGGLLVYCTCSLQPEEGERQAEAFLERHSDMEIIPVKKGELGALGAAATKTGFFRATPALLTETGGIDGFFAARFRRGGA